VKKYSIMKSTVDSYINGLVVVALDDSDDPHTFCGIVIEGVDGYPVGFVSDCWNRKAFVGIDQCNTP
jgi:hypothetical protein